jgi:hypothetical protein
VCFFAGSVQRSDLYNIFRGKLCGPYLFATRLPALVVSVAHIVSNRSKEQMLWVYARWVVTAMQNLLTVWYFTVG